MFETLFGLAARFVLAFLISLGLILVTAWVVLRFGKRRSGDANTRARLAVVDRASVDESRQLILLRRDNVEHLLMIGGRTNVVVEVNIVRAAREVMQAPDPAAAGPLPRAAPVPQSGLWPPQPGRMAPLPRSKPRIERMPDEPTAMSPPQRTEPAQRPAREPLAHQTEEIAAQPVPHRNRAGGIVQLHTVEPFAASVHSPAASANDQRLAELAHRIDVLLRSPSPSAKQAPTEQAAPTPLSPELAPRPGEARAGFKPDQSTALYEELASWLDRPTKN